MADEIRAEMVANVWKVVASAGDEVAEGDTLVILESMKMEIPVVAEADGVVQQIAVDEGSGEVLGGALFVLPGSAYAELCRPGEAEFRTLAVAPAAWGRRVGEALARACAELAAEAGAQAVVISVRDFAKPAKRLYT